MSNIYVVGHNTDRHSYVKVGMTTRSVYKRIGDWDTGSPWQYIVLADVQVPKGDLCLIEQLVHRKLKHLRVRGEWFDANAEEVMTALSEALEACEVDFAEVIDRSPQFQASDEPDEFSDRLTEWHTAMAEIVCPQPA